MLMVVKCGPPHERDRAMVKAETVCRRVEDAGGVNCRAVWFLDLDARELLHTPAEGVIIAGFSARLEEIGAPAFEPLVEAIRAAPCPVLGICGGHQLIAHAFGGDPLHNCFMRPLCTGETPEADYQPGMLTEWGFTTVRRIAGDELFASLPERMTVAQYHAHEVHRLPPDFRLLATNDRCLVQAMRHDRRPVWGVQFHPEEWDEEHPCGSRILGNFASICQGR